MAATKMPSLDLADAKARLVICRKSRRERKEKNYLCSVLGVVAPCHVTCGRALPERAAEVAEELQGLVAALEDEEFLMQARRFENRSHDTEPPLHRGAGI